MKKCIFLVTILFLFGFAQSSFAVSSNNVELSDRTGLVLQTETVYAADLHGDNDAPIYYYTVPEDGEYWLALKTDNSISVGIGQLTLNSYTYPGEMQVMLGYCKAGYTYELDIWRDPFASGKHLEGLHFIITSKKRNNIDDYFDTPDFITEIDTIAEGVARCINIGDRTEVLFSTETVYIADMHNDNDAPIYYYTVPEDGDYWLAVKTDNEVSIGTGKRSMNSYTYAGKLEKLLPNLQAEHTYELDIWRDPFAWGQHLEGLQIIITKEKQDTIDAYFSYEEVQTIERILGKDALFLGKETKNVHERDYLVIEERESETAAILHFQLKNSTQYYSYQVYAKSSALDAACRFAEQYSTVDIAWKHYYDDDTVTIYGCRLPYQSGLTRWLDSTLITDLDTFEHWKVAVNNIISKHYGNRIGMLLHRELCESDNPDQWVFEFGILYARLIEPDGFRNFPMTTDYFQRTYCEQQIPGLALPIYQCIEFIRASTLVYGEKLPAFETAMNQQIINSQISLVSDMSEICKCNINGNTIYYYSMMFDAKAMYELFFDLPDTVLEIGIGFNHSMKNTEDCWKTVEYVLKNNLILEQ